MTVQVPIEDLRRALQLKPSATISGIQISGKVVNIVYNEEQMKAIFTQAEYVVAINEAIKNNKEVYLVYKDDPRERPFLPFKWLNANIIEGTELIVDNYRRFDITQIKLIRI